MKCEQLSSKLHLPTSHPKGRTFLYLDLDAPSFSPGQVRQNYNLETGRDGEVDVQPTALLILAGCENSMTFPQLSFLALCMGNLGKMITPWGNEFPVDNWPNVQAQQQMSERTQLAVQMALHGHSSHSFSSTLPAISIQGNATAGRCEAFL